MANGADYGWNFAEVIADNTKVMSNSPYSTAADKAEALRAAIVASVKQNRFAAMDTCTAMIASVIDAGLAQRVVEVMIQHQDYFMKGIAPHLQVGCNSSSHRDVQRWS